MRRRMLLKISVIDISTAVVTASAQTYTGSALTPSVTVTLNGSTVPSTGYDVQYSNNTNAGTATITITGKGEYTGTATGTFTINKANPVYTAPSASVPTYSGSAQNLVSAGSSSHGTFTYATSQSGTYSSTIPQGTNAGTYTVWWKFTGDANHNDVSATQVSGVSIATKSLSITAKAQTITYGGSIATGTGQVTASGLVSGDSLTAITLTASTNNVPGGTITPSAAATTKGVGNYSVTYNTGTLTINKAAPTYTAPTANSLTYSGSSQYLTTTGSTSHGTIYYSSDGTNWYTTRRTGTNAGNYTTYWKLTGDSNHSDIASTSISTTIAQATGQVTTAPTANTITYSGSAQYLVTAGSGTGTIYYSYRYKSYSASSWGSWSTASTTRPSRTNAGYYEVRYYAAASSDGNYSQSATGTVSSIEIQKATPTYTAPTKKTGLTYTGSAQALLNAGSTSHGTFYYSTNNSTWSTSIPTQTNANTSGYTVYWKLTGDSNHTDVASTTISGITIAKASRTISFNDVYNVVAPSGTITKTATPSAGSGDGAITYSISSTTYATINSSSGKVTAKTSEGSATVTATIAAGTNYNSASATYTLYVFATTHNYDYSGSVKSLLLPPGSYKLECWGAQGGTNTAYSSKGISAVAGGKGGYSVGQLTLTSNQTVYVFVGGQGAASGNGGWNCGGGSTGFSENTNSEGYGCTSMACGGGGTDIALTTSSMSYVNARNNRSDASRKSRMIVAGGGAGGACLCREYQETETQTVYDAENLSWSWNYYANHYLAPEGSIPVTPGVTYTATGTLYSSKKPSWRWYDANLTQLSTTYDVWSATAPDGAAYVCPWVWDGDYSGSNPPYTISISISHSEQVSVTKTENITAAGGVGGGVNGGGELGGNQGGSSLITQFGNTNPQQATTYKYCSAASGSGWWSGGGPFYTNNTDGRGANLRNSGGGSGFVNTAENASYRPSGYTGLQLDSGSTYDGAQTFKAPSGSNETGHAGNGYARITRL